MGLCPPKKGILAETSGWNKLVDRLRKKYGENAEKIAEFAFFSKGDMPTFEEVEAILTKGEKKALSNTVKAGIDKMFKEGIKKAKEILGYNFGLAEGRLAGEMYGKRIGRKDALKEGAKSKEAELKKYQQEMSDRLRLYLETNEQLVGKLGAKQINSIIKKANEIGFSEVKFVKLTEYIDKVIANENYDQDLKTATKLKGKLVKPFADAVRLVNRMKGLDLENLTQKELLDFNNVADKFSKSKNPVTSKLYEAFDTAYAENIISQIEKGVNDRAIERIRETYGILDVTPEDIAFIEEYMNTQDKNFESNLSQAKKKQLRYNIVKIAEYSVVGLREKMASSKIDYETKFGKEFTDRVNEILDIDINDIQDNKQIVELTKIIDNIITNNTNSNLRTATAIARANTGVYKILRYTDPLLKFTAGSFSKATYSTGMILKRIFGNREASASFRSNSGYEQIVNASGIGEKAIIISKKAWDAYKKKNNIDNSARTDLVIGVFARLNNVGFDLVKQKNELPEPTPQELINDRNSGNVTLVEYDSMADVPDALLNLGLTVRTDTIGKKILGSNYLGEKFSKKKTTVSIEVPNSFLEYAESLPSKLGKQEDFIGEKEQLRLSIDRYLESNKSEDQKIGGFLDEIYREVVDKSNTHQEFVDNYTTAYRKEADAANWIAKNIWEKYKPEIKKHSEESLNRNFEGDNQIGYHAKSYVQVQSVAKATGPGEGRISASGTNPKDTGRTLERVNKGTLPEDRVVDYRFEYNTFKSYREVVFEVNSYEAAQTFYYMSKLPEFKNNMFGGRENASFIIESYNSQYDAFRNGRANADPLSKNIIVSIARAFRSAGTALVLGRPSQILSQSTPLLNTIAQNPKYLFQVMAKKGITDIPLFDYSIIGARGQQMGAMGRAEGAEAITYNKAQQAYSKIFTDFSKWMGRNRDRSLSILGKTDNVVAKKSFLAHYLKYMNEIARDASGEKLPKTTVEDLKTEHERMDENRKMAISYAQQFIDETQGSSSREMLSEFSKNSSGGVMSEFAKNAIMPFNNFALNARTRIIEDVRKITYGNKDQKIEAGKDLGGTFLEAVGYATVQVFIVNGIYQYGLKQVLSKAFGVDDGKDFHEFMAGKFKTWYTNITKEMLLSGFGTTVENTGLDAVNLLAYEITKFSAKESGKNYYEWLKDDPTFKRGFIPKKDAYSQITANMGGYGIPLSVGQKSYQDINSYFTGKGMSGYEWQKNEGMKTGPTGLNYINTLEGSYETEIPLTEEERNFFLFLGLANGFSLTTGLGDQDVMRAGEKVKYDIQNTEMKNVPSTKKSKASKLSMGAVNKLSGMGKLK